MRPGVDDGAAPLAEVATAIRFSLDAGDAAVGAASAAEVVTVTVEVTVAAINLDVDNVAAGAAAVAEVVTAAPSLDAGDGFGAATAAEVIAAAEAS